MTVGPDAASAVHTFCHALPGTWHQMGVILAAADALNWYAKIVGQKASELTGELGDLRAPGRTLFLPYLGGERTPHNDAAVRGVWVAGRLAWRGGPAPGLGRERGFGTVLRASL